MINVKGISLPGPHGSGAIKEKSKDRGIKVKANQASNDPYS